MARARELRPIKIHRMTLVAPGPHQAQREQVGEVMALNLPDAIRTWCLQQTGLEEPLFKGNTVSVRNAGKEELYVATD